MRTHNVVSVPVHGEDRKAKQYLDLDPFFLLEVLFLRHQAEAACNRLVQSQLFGCLPTPEYQCSVSQALRDLAALRSSPLVKDAELGEGTQLLDAVEQHLNQLLHSEGPSVGLDPSPIKLELFEKYALFFATPVGFAGQVPAGTPARGKAAFRACCAVVGEKFRNNPESIHLGDLKPFSGFSFLMEPQVEADYRSWLVAAAANFQEAGNEEEPVAAIGEGADLNLGVEDGDPDAESGDESDEPAEQPAQPAPEGAQALVVKDAEPPKGSEELPEPAPKQKRAAASSKRGAKGAAVGRGRGGGNKVADKVAHAKTVKPSKAIADLFGKRYSTT